MTQTSWSSCGVHGCRVIARRCHQSIRTAFHCARAGARAFTEIFPAIVSWVGSSNGVPLVSAFGSAFAHPGRLSDPLQGQHGQGRAIACAAAADGLAIHYHTAAKIHDLVSGGKELPPDFDYFLERLLRGVLKE
mmetsp:Transcript_35073/g.112982  ORF Transcript_35073/g.112982 Transcript_35073/m.112982 type:complete len:134 (-) Transcript_35073:1181-1582(-)